MVNYAVLKFDDLVVSVWKSEVPEFLISMFQESDSNEQDGPGIYNALRDDVLLRLDIMGVSQHWAETEFNRWLARERESQGAWAPGRHESARDASNALTTLSLEEWKQRVPGVLRVRSNPESYKAQDEIERHMCNRERYDDWLFFNTLDVRLAYRLILDACPEIQNVTLDVTGLLQRGIAPAARYPLALWRSYAEDASPALAPVVIMAEGKTDIEAFDMSLKVLHPEVYDFFTFFDFEKHGITTGGVDRLKNFLITLSAAGMPRRVIALFDNDCAGRLKYDVLKELGKPKASDEEPDEPLPRNIVPICLPDIEMASTYPAPGPDGETPCDLNRRAAALELFMGEHLIRCPDSGEFPAIDWKKFKEDPECNQGSFSPEDKDRIQAAFQEAMEKNPSPSEARKTYKEFDSLWQKVFGVARKTIGWQVIRDTQETESAGRRGWL